MRQRSDYPTFSDDELKRRHQAFYGLMEQEGVDAVLIYGSGRYCLGYLLAERLAEQPRSLSADARPAKRR